MTGTNPNPPAGLHEAPLELLLVQTREGLYRVRVTGGAPDGSARTLTLDVASVSPEGAASEAISAWIAAYAPSEPTDLPMRALLDGRELGGVA